MSAADQKTSAPADSSQSKPTSLGSVEVDSSDTGRTFSAAEVAGIVKDRLSRAEKATSDKLSAVAEQAAIAAAARVRADLDAEVAELAEVAGVTAKDLLDARRLKRSTESMLQRARKADLSMRIWKKG